MPGKHKKKKKGGGKLAIALMLSVFSLSTLAYFPHKIGSQEVRFLGSSIGGLNSGDWGIEGQLIGVKSKGDLSLSGVFGMSKDSAHIGAEVVYAINPLVYFSLTGKFHNSADLGGHARVYFDLPIGDLDFMPFVTFSAKKVGSIGLVTYFHLKQVLFSVGVLYKPPFGDSKKHNVSFVVGSGFHGIKRIK